MVARGNLAEDACSGGGDDGGKGCEMKMSEVVPPSASWSFSDCEDTADRDNDEEGPIRRKRSTKMRERSEGGLRQGREENQATGAPCVTVHLHMVVELGELWRCTGAGAC